MGNFFAGDIAQGRANGGKHAKGRIGRSGGTAGLGNQQCAGDGKGNQHHARAANPLTPDQRNASHHKQGGRLEDGGNITNGHVLERQDKADNGEDFEGGAQKHPGIENAGNIAAITHYENQGQAPDGGGNAAHQENLQGRRIGQHEFHETVIGHKGAAGQDHAGDAAQIG